MEASTITVNVKHLSSKVYEVTINGNATVENLKQKVSEQSKIEVDGIKLIFRGKILKNNSDCLNDLNITTGHTIHMVKNKTKTTSNPPLSQPSNPPQNSPNLPAPNPFANLMGGGNPGLSGMGGMGGTQGMNFPAMQQAMQNPQMQEMVQQLMGNPEMLRNMINSNPMLQGMVSNNPQLQAMMNNPDMMRNMSTMMRNGQMPGFPGTGQTPPPNSNATPTPGTTQTPTSSQSGTTPPPPNMGTPTGLPGFSGQNGMPDLNAMMNDPNFQARMNQFQQMYQGGQPGGQGVPNMTGMNMPIPPQNVSNPEQTYKEQLAQLEMMGFTNKELNIAVLKQTYGNVQMAIEKLINM